MKIKNIILNECCTWNLLIFLKLIKQPFHLILMWISFISDTWLSVFFYCHHLQIIIRQLSFLFSLRENNHPWVENFLNIVCMLWTKLPIKTLAYIMKHLSDSARHRSQGISPHLFLKLSLKTLQKLVKLLKNVLKKFW